MKILAIGNSFSEDAMYYLKDIAGADEVEVKVVNLYIGGCSLERHWENIRTGAKEYQYQLNGRPQDRMVSVKEALDEEEWDYIVTQQASHDSGWQDTYEPFLHQIVRYLKEEKPQAEILLLETWAYEVDSTHECFERYHCDQMQMYERLRAAYRKAAEEHQLRLIPCGEVIQKLRSTKPFDYQHGGISLCRDGYHMHYIYGRYALAATWYVFVFQKSIRENPYVPTTELMWGETADAEKIETIKKVVESYRASFAENKFPS